MARKLKERIYDEVNQGFSPALKKHMQKVHGIHITTGFSIVEMAKVTTPTAPTKRFKKSDRQAIQDFEAGYLAAMELVSVFNPNRKKEDF